MPREGKTTWLPRSGGKSCPAVLRPAESSFSIHQGQRQKNNIQFRSRWSEHKFSQRCWLLKWINSKKGNWDQLQMKSPVATRTCLFDCECGTLHLNWYPTTVKTKKQALSQLVKPTLQVVSTSTTGISRVGTNNWFNSNCSRDRKHPTFGTNGFQRWPLKSN